MLFCLNYHSKKKNLTPKLTLELKIRTFKNLFYFHYIKAHKDSTVAHRKKQRGVGMLHMGLYEFYPLLMNSKEVISILNAQLQLPLILNSHGNDLLCSIQVLHSQIIISSPIYIFYGPTQTNFEKTPHI